MARGKFDETVNSHYRVSGLVRWWSKDSFANDWERLLVADNQDIIQDDVFDCRWASILFDIEVSELENRELPTLRIASAYDVWMAWCQERLMSSWNDVKM